MRIESPGCPYGVTKSPGSKPLWTFLSFNRVNIEGSLLTMVSTTALLRRLKLYLQIKIKLVFQTRFTVSLCISASQILRKRHVEWGVFWGAKWANGGKCVVYCDIRLGGGGGCGSGRWSRWQRSPDFRSLEVGISAVLGLQLFRFCRMH